MNILENERKLNYDNIKYEYNNELEYLKSQYNNNIDMVNNQFNDNLNKLKNYYEQMIRARKIYDEMNKDINKYEQRIIRGNIQHQNNSINNDRNVELPDFKEVVDNNNNFNNKNNNDDNNNNNKNDLPNYEEVHNQNNVIINNNDEEINDLPSYEELNKNKIIKYVNEDGIEVIEYNENIKMKFDQRECLICIGEFEKGEKLSVLRCKHCYHEMCLKDWIKKAKGIFCPLCQASRE